MAAKKKTKKKFAYKKTVSKTVANEGFFQRMKEIIKSEMPKPEKVRVKTFIVEKPVIIREKASRVESDSDDVFDGKKSRYSRSSIATGMGLVKEKKKPVVEEEDYGTGADEDNFDQDSGEDNFDSQGEEDFNEAEGSEESDLSEDDSMQSEEFGGEETQSPAPVTHARSRGMFNNIWWKKALFWAILFWLFILAVSMAMQAMKLIMVDLTRQWWVFLGILIVIEMIYFKFIDGKVNF